MKTGICESCGRDTGVTIRISKTLNVPSVGFRPTVPAIIALAKEQDALTSVLCCDCDGRRCCECSEAE